MTEDELQALAAVAIRARYLVIALIQLLCERKVFEQPETEVLGMLEQWAKDLEMEDARELRIEERVRRMQEAWNKLPKQ